MGYKENTARIGTAIDSPVITSNIYRSKTHVETFNVNTDVLLPVGLFIMEGPGNKNRTIVSYLRENTANT